MEKSVMIIIAMSLISAWAFSGVFNIRGWRMFAGAFGGMLAWAVHALCSQWMSAAFATLIAGTAGALYAQIMARIGKSPATLFMAPTMIVMVPGGSLYQTMQCAIQGDWTGFLSCGTTTVQVAAALAFGMMLVSSVGRAWAKLRD